MTEILHAVALALVFGFSILGYLGALGALKLVFNQKRIPFWARPILSGALYCLGVGSIFVAPAFAYGRFKAEISSIAFGAFWITEAVVLLLLIVVVKIWIPVVPSVITGPDQTGSK